jgi:hypothetical protein
MKKNLLKLGALAFVVALAFGIAACPTPTDETGSSGEDVIIRLWLNDNQKNIVAGTDSALIVLGDIVKAEHKTALKAEPTFPLPDGSQTIGTGGPNNDDGVKILPIITSASGLTIGTSGTTKTSGIPGTLIQLADGDYSDLVGKADVAIAQNQVNKVDKGVYIDFLLYEVKRNKTNRDRFTEKAATLQEGGSYYVWLNLQDGTAAGLYIYTKDSISSRHKPGDEIKGKYNGNVEKIDIHTGINDLYLANFSNE